MDTDQIVPKEPSTALVTSLFNEGKAGIVFSGPWFLGEIAKNIDYGLAVLPKIDEAGGKPMTPWMGLLSIGLSFSGNPKKALKSRLWPSIKRSLCIWGFFPGQLTVYSYKFTVPHPTKPNLTIFYRASEVLSNAFYYLIGVI